MVIQENMHSPGHYNVSANKIAINKPSLVTYLHEFCHYKRIHLKQKNTEHIARGWSISLFYLATPKLCLKSIKSGKIIHQNRIQQTGDKVK